MKVSPLLFVFLPLVGNAQRIVPARVGLDPLGTLGRVNAMAVFDGRLIVAGRFAGMEGQTARNICAWDGANGIAPMGDSTASPTMEVYDVMPYAGGVVFGGLGAGGTGRVFYWDGDTTIALGSPGTSRVRCFAEFNGDLIAGGSFVLMDGDTVNRIARWDGTAWWPLGSGLNNEVRSLAVHDGALYVGGQFTATGDGSVPLARVARWNGNAFEPLQTGLNHTVTQLEVVDGALWLAGNFDHTADSSSALEHFARWNGTAFEPLLTEVTSSVGQAPMLVPLGDFGILARARKYDDLIYQNGAWYEHWLRGAYCTQEFQGELYVGGELELTCADSSVSLGKLLPGSGHTEMEVAGLKAWIRSDGRVCYDVENNRPDFVPVDGGGASAIYAHGHYVVGYVGDSAFTSSFSPYDLCNGYSQGPRCAERSEPFTDRYQRTWPIDIGMLWDHAANWSQTGYVTPEVISAWPVAGDESNGEPEHIAPFQDNDADGNYEPDDGELPVIKGDKAVLIEASDQLTDGLPEIFPSMFDSQLLVHGYNSSPPDELYQTLFVTYTFTNRSDRYYDSVVVAMQTDADIGCPDNDFIGCDPELDMFYVYNATDTDQFCPQGFGAHPPALGIVGLSAPMRSFIYYNREGPSFTTDPFTTVHAAHYAEGVWKDGSPVINTVTNEPTRFTFSEYPDVPGGYHEVELTNPDRRGIASFGPFFNVAPGDRICFDMAFVYARDTTQDNIQNTRVLQQKVIALKEWYAQQGLGCDEYATVGLHEAAQCDDRLQLFPNPASNVVTARRADTKEALVVMIHSSTGQLVWSGQWPKSSASLTVDVRALTDGVYLFRARGAAYQQSQRLVVAR